MDISSTTGATAQAFAIGSVKIAREAAKAQGDATVAMIEQSAPPVGQNGEGSRINTYG